MPAARVALATSALALLASALAWPLVHAVAAQAAEGLPRLVALLCALVLARAAVAGAASAGALLAATEAGSPKASKRSRG